MTALMYAAYGGHLEVLQYLVEQGAEKDNVNNNGFTALMYAAQNGRFGVVEFLLEDGVDVNKVATDGWTALHLVAGRGHAEILSILMAYGASLTARTNNGRLPIDMAANDAIRVLIRDEPSRRMDHGHKRAVIPELDAEQENNRPALEGKGEGHSSALASGSATLTAEEMKYEAEVNEESASSDEEEISETKIHYRHISSNKRV